MEEYPKVSVIIVSYNVQDFMDLCLDAVTRALVNVPHEIFVVDNQSVDGTLDLVRSKYPGVQLIANKENLGFSKANNQALALAKGQYIHFLNPDTIITEDFYAKTLAYMDAHPQVGALGPRLIDADGRYAPDSKKSFPSFWVSVAKVVGLSKAFPKSRIFNRYYAAHIGEFETARVDILSGCCMLVNKSNLLQAGGGFDEAYFMYCEDVDMCHRLTLHGFENIYYPEVSVVHYKGESTRKLTYSYMKIFHEAHALFVEKYYPKKLGILFNLALNAVLGLRNVFNVLKYLFVILKIYLLDALIITATLFLFQNYWFEYVYNTEKAAQNFTTTIPVFLIIWMLSLFLNGAYDKPYSLFRTGRGMVWGTMAVLAFYGLLPFEYRHSRAVILFSGILATVVLLLFRTIFAQLRFIDLVPRGKTDFKSIILASEDEIARIKKRLQQEKYNHHIVGNVYASDAEGRADEHYLGSIDNILQIQDVLAINEIIFSAQKLPYSVIIKVMDTCKDKCSYKILPANSAYIIASKNHQNLMDVYGLSNFNIGMESSKRNKRIIDIMLSVFTYLMAPFLLMCRNNALLSHAGAVLSGKKTWVGYAAIDHHKDTDLPPLKPGVFPPYILAKNVAVPLHIRQKIDYKYAKEYGILDDIQYYWKNIKFFKK